MQVRGRRLEDVGDVCDEGDRGDDDDDVGEIGDVGDVAEGKDLRRCAKERSCGAYTRLPDVAVIVVVKR